MVYSIHFTQIPNYSIISWKPDFYFPSQKHAYFEQCIIQFLVQILPVYDELRSFRMLYSACPRRLKAFKIKIHVNKIYIQVNGIVQNWESVLEEINDPPR